VHRWLCFIDHRSSSRSAGPSALAREGLRNVMKAQNNHFKLSASCLFLSLPSRGYMYAGLEFGAECYCGHKIQAPNASDSECNMECKGEKSNLCGGANRLSIYRMELSQESARRCESDTLQQLQQQIPPGSHRNQRCSTQRYQVNSRKQWTLEIGSQKVFVKFFGFYIVECRYSLPHLSTY